MIILEYFIIFILEEITNRKNFIIHKFFIKASLPSQPSKMISCLCCPYGYHIDLDFVRYCETLANAVPSDGELKRRDRRRQRKSMEVMLGFEQIIQLQQITPVIEEVIILNDKNEFIILDQFRKSMFRYAENDVTSA